ncbi:MAG: hypothetical protein HC884_13600 [Chloroflexaceae bacterium]|nr:hypothetical protein [Chloroflexaceae bacterium]
MLSRVQKSLYTSLVLCSGVLLLGCFLASLPVVYNDDTCVYFTYARNLVAGNWFAYDPRGIPSEGFTSLLFLLLLVPFEALGMNTMFAAVLLNIIGLLFIVFVATILMKTDHLLAFPDSGIFALTLLVLLTIDDNVFYIVNRSLETLLGPALLLPTMVTLVAASDLRAYTPGFSRGHWFTIGFLLASFFAFLVRPENIIFSGLCGMLLLFLHPRRAVLIRYTAGFGGILVAYYVWKWKLFGDVFPTGFYRKVHADDTLFPGLSYVLSFGRHYAVPLGLCGLFLVVFWRTGRLRLLRHRSILPLLMVGIATPLFFLLTNPLIGYSWRYLINTTVIMYIFLAFMWALLFRWFARKCAQSNNLLPYLLFATGILLAAMGYFSTRKVQFQDIDIHAKATREFQEHLYIQFGSYLRENLPDHQRITLVFGDAGCIPYSFGSIFIDPNGLTEPYVARLFKVTDIERKTEQFVNYILSWKPDIIVLGYGSVSNNTWEIFKNLHSPFGNNSQIGVFSAYRQHGMAYLCSVDSYHDLHLGVLPDSPNFSRVAPVLLKYCEQHGYVLDEGLVVQEGTKTVLFPRISLEESENVP